MRIVWLVGGPASAKPALERALAAERMGVPFAVHTATSVQEIPQEHYANRGVVALLDAFSAQDQGFAGVRTLRDAGFKGHIFLFGEPAPEEAANAFNSMGLSGFFPPYERADYFFIGGVIHAAIAYDGNLDVNRFILPGGRSSFETLRSLKDFNAFSAKLATFVSKFGIELGRLRKVLMALSLPHVKTDTGQPAIDQPFSIYYGMDPVKVVLGARSFSRGVALPNLVSSYTEALVAHRSDKPFQGAMFPEFFHLTKATQNLLLFSGSATATTSAVDPVYLLTVMPFPAKANTATASSYFFSCMHVVPSLEIAEGEEAPAASGEAPMETAATALNESVATTSTPNEDFTQSAPADSAPEGSMLLDSSDVGALLAEPKIMGDAPVLVPVAGVESSVVSLSSSGSAFAPEESEEESGGAPVDILAAPEGDLAPSEGVTGDLISDQSEELQRKLNAALAELEHHKQANEAMGADIKRLMKERRQPTTDRELRDSNQRLAEQVKTLTGEKLKALEMVSTRDKQIELMKVQIDTLKKEKAA